MTVKLFARVGVSSECLTGEGSMSSLIYTVDGNFLSCGLLESWPPFLAGCCKPKHPGKKIHRFAIGRNVAKSLGTVHEPQEPHFWDWPEEISAAQETIG